MKVVFFDILTTTLMAASLFFFYQCTVFLTEKDYLAATLTLFIGFTIVRAGVELARLAVIMRKEE